MGNMPPSDPDSPGTGSGPDWGEMKDKLTAARGADRMILIAGLVFFVDSFLPWYGVNLPILGTYTRSGWGMGGLAVLAVIFALLDTIFAAMRVLGTDLDLGDVPDGLVYIILGGGAFLFTLLRWLTQTSHAKYGLYVALIAGAFLAYGGWMKLQKKS